MLAAPALHQEDQRIATLRRLEILDSAPEEIWDHIVKVASVVCDRPIALVSLVDQERQWFKARKGLEAQETPREVAFCPHAILQDGVFEVEDASQDERFVDNPLVTGDPEIRHYAGAPLYGPNGMPLGTVCVIGRSPGRLSDTQKQVLQELASQAQDILRLREAALDLKRAFREQDPQAVINDVAHELNTPLTPILMRLHVLRRMLHSEDQMAQLDAIESNIDRLRGVVDGAIDKMVGAKMARLQSRPNGPTS